MSTTSGRQKRSRKFRPVSSFEELAAQARPSEQPTPESPAREPMADHPPAPAPSKKRKRWPWLVLGLVGLGAVFVWLLPVIVANTPALDWIVAAATREVRGDVTVESASLEWLSPPVVTGVEVRDPEGQPVLKVPKVDGDRSLLSLLRNWTNLGRFRLERPTLSVVLRPDGSNLEDVLAGLLESSDEESTPVDLRVEIVDGVISIRHADTQKTWEIQQFQLALSLSSQTDGPLEVETSGIVVDGQLPSRFAAGLKVQLGNLAVKTSPSAQRGGEATVKAENLPLKMFAPLLQRFAPGVEAAGRLSTNVQGRFRAPAALESLSVEGTLGARDLRVAAPALGTDRVALAQLDVGCRLAYEDGKLQIDRLTTQSDVGSASLSGTFELGDASSPELLAWLARQTFDAQGQIDLARLANLLPDTLRIRDQTKIISGQLQAALAAQPKPDRIEWTGRVEASNLTAVACGRRLVWQQPILIALAAYQTAEGPVVESLTCESDFLKADLSGTPQEMTARAAFDLGRLATELSQFVDLGELALAGDGWAQLTWHRGPDQAFRADGELELKDFQFTAGDRRPWSEPSLVASFSATGRDDSVSGGRLDAAKFEVAAGDAPPDQVEVRLTQPVENLRRDSQWPLEIRSKGQLARWLPRIAPWVELDDLQLAGSYELDAQVTASADSVAAKDARLTVADLKFRSGSRTVAEPKAEIIASGSWDHAGRRLALTSASLRAGELSATVGDVVAAFEPEGKTELAGTVQCQASLQELARWAVDPSSPPPWQLFGRLTGNVTFRQQGQTITGTLETTIDDLVVAHQGGNRFEQKRVQLKGRGSYDTQIQLVVLEEASLTSGPVGATAAGRVAAAGEQPELEIDARIDYDMEQLSELARSYLGDGLYLTGRGTCPVAFRGPLTLKSLQANTTVGWSWGEVYGFQLGAGELRAALVNGVVTVEPTTLEVSEGQVRVAAQLRLDPQPLELYVPPGPLVENVRINPRMCAHGLQYIAPVLSGVATAEGRFSVEVEGCRIPLADPAAGELAGRMAVHSAEIGPGPLVRELALALGYSSPARLARESTIDFRMVDGRIYHRGVRLEFPDLVISTHGWVGLDKSLGLMAEMSVPPKWLGSDPLIDTALRNQIIRVPIGGTLQRPKVDQKALAEVSRQFIQKAATNVIEDQLMRGLKRLLDQPR